MKEVDKTKYALIRINESIEMFEKLEPNPDEFQKGMIEGYKSFRETLELIDGKTLEEIELMMEVEK